MRSLHRVGGWRYWLFYQSGLRGLYHFASDCIDNLGIALTYRLDSSETRDSGKHKYPALCNRFSFWVCVSVAGRLFQISVDTTFLPEFDPQ